eukprot:PhM_4_TR9277/c0_g1_i1/m.52615
MTRSVSLLILIALCCVSVANAAIPQSEFSALRMLYNATGGNAGGWFHAPNWANPSADPCTYEGVTCSADNSSVVELNLLTRGLSGSLPDVFGGLPNLTTLILASNYRMKGPLPGSVFGPKLETLDITANEGLAGSTLPNTLVNAKNLKSLRMIDCSLAGAIPELGTAVLQDLAFAGNAFTSLPESVCLSQASLVSIHAEEGMSSASGLPSCFGNPAAFASLSVLRLSACNITAPLPAIHGWTAMSYLALDRNHFSGTLVDGFSSHNDVTVFAVDKNDLTGTIPTSVLALPQVSNLNLGYNNFNVAPPAALANITKSAWDINIAHAGLTGPLPDSYAALCTETRVIRLYGNPGLSCPRPAWAKCQQNGFDVFLLDACP